MILKKMRLLPVVLAFLSIPVVSRGEGNIHFGQLQVHPFVSLSETYNDNIYSTASDKKSDYIATTTPGISLLFPYRVHRLSLEYNAVIRNYNDHTEENTTDQNAKADLDLKIGSFLGLKLNDAYSKGHEPRGSSSTGTIEKYETNQASVSATYQLTDRSKVQLDYSRTAWSFKTSDFRDRDEDLVSGYVYYRFLPKTSAFLEYDYKTVDYRSTGGNILDNKVQSGLMGLTWEMSEISKGTLKGGYLKKEYDSSLVNGVTTWAASLDLNFDFSDYTNLKMMGQRSVNEASLKQTRYFTTTGGYLELSHKFYRRLAASIRGSYGEDEFSDAVAPETKARVDVTTTGGVGLKYFMRDWLEFALDYNRADRDSNLDANDYQINSYTTTVKMAL